MTPQTEEQRLGLMLSALEEIGVPSADLAEVFGLVDLDADTRRWVYGPVVIHRGPSAWDESLPRKLFDHIRAERLEIALGLHPRWIVGPCELTAVMYNATCDAPLHRDCTEIYLWASAQATVRVHKKNTLDEVWALLKPSGIRVTDDDVLDRGGRLWNDYWRLCDEIRRKVAKASPLRGASPPTPFRTAREAAPVVANENLAQAPETAA